MITIHAPFPGTIGILEMPNPELDDSVVARIEIKIKKAMDGTRQTHIKTTGRRIFEYSFILTQLQFLTFKVFYNTYIDKQWKIIDHNNITIQGYIQTNPLTFTAAGRNKILLSIAFEGTII